MQCMTSISKAVYHSARNSSTSLDTLLINFKQSCQFLSILSVSVFLVCPQQGATTIIQMELVPRPKGVAILRCDFNVPPDPTHSDTGFLYIAWVMDKTRLLYNHLYDAKYVSKSLCISPSAVLFRHQFVQ